MAGLLAFLLPMPSHPAYRDSGSDDQQVKRVIINTLGSQLRGQLPIGLSTHGIPF